MHSLTNCLLHCVFSTKNREKFLTPEIQSRLWPYLTGIACNNHAKLLSIGGYFDHVHILLTLPSTVSISKIMQLLKGNSSKWIRETFSTQNEFGWQEGYGAFSVSISDVPRTIAYIQNQQEHHRTKTFQEELEGFLKKQGIGYNSNDLSN